MRGAPAGKARGRAALACRVRPRGSRFLMPTPTRQKKKNFYESKTRRAEVSAVREVLLMKKFPLFFALLLALRALPALAAADGGGPGDGGAKAAGRNQAEADDGEDDDD